MARLLPDLLAAQPELSHPAPAAAELSQWQRQRLFEALSRTFRENGQPMLLLIDDLQWCDGETVAWLRTFFGVPQNADAPYATPAQLLIVGTVRLEEVDAEHPFSSLLLDLRVMDQVTEIALAPLNQTETVELAAQVANTVLDAATSQRIYVQTEGNPLFIVETVRAERGEHEAWGQSAVLTNTSPTALPSKVLTVIQSRLAQLSPGAHQLACMAAVVGRSFTFELL